MNYKKYKNLIDERSDIINRIHSDLKRLNRINKDIYHVRECPECGGKMFEEEIEWGNYHPDNERIHQENMDVCEKCSHNEALIY